MSRKILCVAEKPSIARAVSEHLCGGRPITRNSQNKYIKNYDFQYNFGRQWGVCNATMTAVIGHTFEFDFISNYRQWHSCDPVVLFEAPCEAIVKEKQDVVNNIAAESRNASVLFIWTDCDREGEYIGTEVRDIALRSNPRLEVKRAKFSNIERAHILRAAQTPVNIDERQAQAVAARIELDLRLGAAFTRMQTLALQKIPGLENRKAIISYGSCQFPTLGFVVDRWRRVKNFVPEPFWSIKMMLKRDNVNVNFNWDRNRLFCRMTVVILFERCILANTARVSKVDEKPARKWKPLPLTTVELQKAGSRLLHLTSQKVMKIAEDLYTAGFISYPRTETDQFDKGIDLRALVEKQTHSQNWGDFARGLLGGGFSQPRNGKHNDQAHPPIHPVAFADPTSKVLNDPDSRKVYEYIARRFLACCSTDAIGKSTTVSVNYGPEGFHASGLVVLERNYLDVYPYDKWTSSQALPDFRVGEEFVPTDSNITDGKTSAPGYLTEPELITLMDVNGIGTDATMAEHIAKIQEREYAIPRVRGGDAPRGRGRGGGARGGRGGGNAASGSRGGVVEFLPTNLGVALVESYDAVGFENSLSKPFLRREMEEMMKKVCEGTMTKDEVVHYSVEQYRDMFLRAAQKKTTFQQITRRYMAMA